MSGDIAARVIKIVSEVLEVAEENIKLEHAFVEDLDAESIQSVELMAAFEEEFGIELDEDQAMAVKTVGAAVDFIKKCIEEQK
jgi:acyl carrier protein